MFNTANLYKYMDKDKYPTRFYFLRTLPIFISISMVFFVIHSIKNSFPAKIHLTRTVKAGVSSMVPVSSWPISRATPAIDDDTIKSPIFIVQ